MKIYDVIVVGAGAAGMMAAGIAAKAGLQVLLLEKMDKSGLKLGITGKGRCNLTNDVAVAEFLKHVGPEPKFLRSAFSRFYNAELIDFFCKIGVETIVERGGRVFPASESALDVVYALRRWINDNKVLLQKGRCVEILMEEGMAVGVKLESGDLLYSKSVIVATGGNSYKATGSSGDGYILARKSGHIVVEPKPVLVPFETGGNIAKRLQGLSLKNVNVTVLVDGSKKAALFGEMLFTHFGVSGPVILSLSRIIPDDIADGKNVVVSIDLKPALDDKTLDNRILKDLDSHGKMKFGNLLQEYLPSSFIPVMLDVAQIGEDKLCGQINSEQRKKFRNLLKDFRLNVTGTRSWNEAIVTSGGVSVKEINQKTMESKLVKNLYFVGEVLDIDADTGGYNLQIAFSTGWVAGNSVADGLKRV